MTTRTTRTGMEKQQEAKANAKAAATPTTAEDMPEWAKAMMVEIKRGNEEVARYREETKAEIALCKEEIALCKEEIAKGRRETKEEMVKWARNFEENAKAQFESLYGELRLAGEKVNKLAAKMDERMKEVDEALNGQSDALTNMEGRLKEIEREVGRLKGRSEDLEARSRRNNIRILGVREGEEAGRRPSDFVASLLKEKLGLAVMPTLDVAHRAYGGRRVGEGVPPRAFIVRCQYYTEKEEILKKAREMEKTPEGRRGKIHIYPDYTQEVNSKRAAFKEARSLLRTCERVRYGLKYPATLLITPEGGQTKLFEKPKDAVEYIRKELSPR